MEPIRLPHSTIPISEKRWWFPPVSSICHNQNVQVLPDDDPKKPMPAEYDAQHQPGDEFPPHHPPPVRNRQFPSAMAWWSGWKPATRCCPRCSWSGEWRGPAPLQFLFRFENTVWPLRWAFHLKQQHQPTGPFWRVWRCRYPGTVHPALPYHRSFEYPHWILTGHPEYVIDCYDPQQDILVIRHRQGHPVIHFEYFCLPLPGHHSRSGNIVRPSVPAPWSPVRPDEIADTYIIQ